jgi:hypothetical protein
LESIQILPDSRRKLEAEQGPYSPVLCRQPTT